MGDYLDRPLIDYLPNVLKEVREFQALMFAEQPEILGAFEGIDNALQNEFVVTATEYGIRRWEKILSIIPNPAAESLEFRRERILFRLRTYPPFTERWLKDKLDELFGVDNVTFSIEYNRYRIDASINQPDINLTYEVKLLFKRVIPANMGLAFTVISPQLESTLFVGLNVTPKIRIRRVFNMTPERHPFVEAVYIGVLGGIRTHIKFEME